MSIVAHVSATAVGGLTALATLLASAVLATAAPAFADPGHLASTSSVVPAPASAHDIVTASRPLTGDPRLPAGRGEGPATGAMPAVLRGPFRYQTKSGGQGCLDGQDGGVHVRPCNGAANQKWSNDGTGSNGTLRFVTVNNRCLDGFGGHAQQVFALTCDGSKGQFWFDQFKSDNGSWLFINARFPNQCLDVRDWGASDIVQLWDCHAGANQRWF